jgi:hypothetical protein
VPAEEWAAEVSVDADVVSRALAAYARHEGLRALERETIAGIERTLAD